MKSAESIYVKAEPITLQIDIEAHIYKNIDSIMDSFTNELTVYKECYKISRPISSLVNSYFYNSKDIMYDAVCNSIEKWNQAQDTEVNHWQLYIDKTSLSNVSTTPIVDSNPVELVIKNELAKWRQYKKEHTKDSIIDKVGVIPCKNTNTEIVTIYNNITYIVAMVYDFTNKDKYGVSKRSYTFDSTTVFDKVVEENTTIRHTYFETALCEWNNNQNIPYVPFGKNSSELGGFRRKVTVDNNCFTIKTYSVFNSIHREILFKDIPEDDIFSIYSEGVRDTLSGWKHSSTFCKGRRVIDI